MVRFRDNPHEDSVFVQRLPEEQPAWEKQLSCCEALKPWLDAGSGCRQAILVISRRHGPSIRTGIITLYVSFLMKRDTEVQDPWRNCGVYTY